MNYEDRITKEYVEGLLAGMPKVQFGSYVGTGTYGASNPNTIICGFPPKMVVVQRKDGTAYSDRLIVVSGVTSSGINGGDTNILCSWSSTGVSWYSPCTNQYNAPGYQYNRSGETYCWFAIG